MKLPWRCPSLAPYAELWQRPADPDDEGLTVRFLGTSSLLFDDGTTAILSDGFVSRPGKLRVFASKIGPDRAAVRAAIERLEPAKPAAVFCVHSHYDHAMDAPLWVLETGADLVGSGSTAEIGRGLAVPENRIRVVGDGDTLRYGDFTLTFIGSLHSPGDISPGVVERPLVPPARVKRWHSDTCFSVHIDHPRGPILLHASANVIPGSLRGYRAEVVYLGIGQLGRQSAEFTATYWDEVVGVTGARRVIPVHWDDFFYSLDQPLRPIPYAADDMAVSMERLRTYAERDGVEILLPIPWEPTLPLREPR